MVTAAETSISTPPPPGTGLGESVLRFPSRLPLISPRPTTRPPDIRDHVEPRLFER